MKLHLNFGGFYDSIHSSNIESRIEQEVEWLNDEENEYATNESALEYEERIDWNATHDNYASEFTNLLNNELDLNLAYIGIDSPRFYNFRNDELIVDINEEDLKSIELHLLDSNFIEYVDERLSSRDGFHSFYDNGIDTPFDNIYGKSLEDAQAKAHLIELYIEWKMDQENIFEYIYELEFFLELVD